MKKLWIAFLALALAALIPGAALAAAGDAEIRADGEVLTEYSDGLTGAVVNPYSENLELAQQFALELLRNTSAPTRYSLSDAMNEPLE